MKRFSSIQRAVRFCARAALVCLVAAPLSAHEFWIDVSHGVADPGAEVTAALRVGQDLKGASHPYLSARFTDFVLVHEDNVWPVAGREGDRPGATIRPTEPGLYIIAQRSVPFLLTYDEPGLFAKFLDYEGLSPFLEDHRARGLPETGFAERYLRHAKALFQVGPVEGARTDRLLGGLELELVAETNPFAAGLTELPARLYDNGAPAADRQVALFHRAGEQVGRTIHQTDAAGRVILPLRGPGEYLLSSVSLSPRDEEPVAWQSEWASLFFRLGPDEQNGAKQ